MYQLRRFFSTALALFSSNNPVRTCVRSRIRAETYAAAPRRVRRLPRRRACAQEHHDDRVRQPEEAAEVLPRHEAREQDHRKREEAEALHFFWFGARPRLDAVARALRCARAASKLGLPQSGAAAAARCPAVRLRAARAISSPRTPWAAPFSLARLVWP